MHQHREVRSFFCAIAQAQCSQHITLSRDSYARSTPHAALAFYLFPKVIFRLFHLIIFGISLNLFDDLVYLFHFQINDVIHDALRILHMLLELIKIERRIGCKRLIDIAEKIDAQQTTRIVRAQGNFTTRIGAHGSKTKVCITIRNAFAQNGIPK